MPVQKIGFRLDDELLQAIDAFGYANAMSRTEAVRVLLRQQLGLAVGPDLGYREGKSIAIAAAQAILSEALSRLPATLHELAEQGGGNQLLTQILQRYNIQHS